MSKSRDGNCIYLEVSVATAGDSSVPSLLRIRLLRILLVIAFALSLSSQTVFTMLHDTITQPDGNPFTGTLVLQLVDPGISDASDTSPLVIPISEGALDVGILPSSTDPAGSYYQAHFSSTTGAFTWTETWQIPPSASPVSLSTVRKPNLLQPVTPPDSNPFPISIGQVLGLSSDLASINNDIKLLNPSIPGGSASSAIVGLESSVSDLTAKLSAMQSQITSLSTALSGVSATVTSLAATSAGQGPQIQELGARVSALEAAAGANNNSLSVMNSSLSALGSRIGAIEQSLSALTVSTQNTLVFVDAETPSGNCDAINLVFELAAAPNPSSSLKLYKNGLLLKQGGDYNLAGATITFVSASGTPQAMDSILAFYRH